MTKKTILIVGDSLSAAYGLPVRQGWVHLLQERLNDSSWRIINASMSGDTTRGARARLPYLLHTHTPDLVVLQLGANDFLRGHAADAMHANLHDMVTWCKEAGAQVLLVGMKLPAALCGLGKLLGYDLTPYLGAYDRIKQQHAIRMVPFLLKGVLRPSLFQSDRMHPNELAQPIMLRNVWRVLGPMLSEFA